MHTFCSKYGYTIAGMPSATLHHYTVHFHNSEEYHSLKQEIFTKDSYYFESDTPLPRIIDAGAHIGMATLYFKYLYPAARITCIEPLPENLELLAANIADNHLTDVAVVPAALAPAQSELRFFTDDSGLGWHSTSGFLPGAWNGQQHSKQLSVPTCTLSSLLTERVDLLKLDIEGLESAVLREAAPQLKHVQHLICEFHPHREQSIEKLVEFLQKHFPEVEVSQGGKLVTRLHKATGLSLISAWR